MITRTYHWDDAYVWSLPLSRVDEICTFLFADDLSERTLLAQLAFLALPVDEEGAQEKQNLLNNILGDLPDVSPVPRNEDKNVDLLAQTGHMPIRK